MTRPLTHFILGQRGRMRPRRNCTSASPSPRSLSSSSSQAPKLPSKTTSSCWERGAKLVKNTDVTNPYLEQVRSEVVDPALQLKTIENELCGAIGKALGRQGEKVLIAIRDMKDEHVNFLECIRKRAYEEALQSALRHNEARKRAIKARWELLVHRQAVGFTVDNHSVVHNTFVIGETLPENMEEILTLVPSEGESKHEPDKPSSTQQPTTKVWGDQLSWWQRVGRWK